jgi:capsular polysaccharide biosynthesis protein
MEQQGYYEKEIELGQLIRAVLRKSGKILIVGILFAVLIAGYKFITADSTVTNQEQITYSPVIDYIGRAKIFLGSDTDTATAEAIRSYLTGNDVIQNVIGETETDLNYYNIFNLINLANSTDTMILITVVGTDEALVQNITDALATIGSEKISEKFNKDDVIVLEPAYTEIRQYNAEVKSFVKNNSLLIKSVIKYAIIGFVLGAFLAAGIYLLIIMTDSSIKDEKDIEGYLGLPVIGKIPAIKGTKKLIDKGKSKKKLRLTQYSAE